MPVPIGVSLEEDSARRVFQSVSSNGEGGGEVGKVEDWFRQEQVF